MMLLRMNGLLRNFQNHNISTQVIRLLGTQIHILISGWEEPLIRVQASGPGWMGLTMALTYTLQP